MTSNPNGLMPTRKRIAPASYSDGETPVPQADRLVVRSGTFSGPQAEPLRNMRLSPRHCLQHLTQRPTAWT
jgi:hypothetical protein